MVEEQRSGEEASTEEPKLRWVEVPLPDPVRDGLAWHYTDAVGLLGIVGSNDIWASAPTALNDTSELRYGEALIRRVWRDRSSAEVLPEPCVKFVNAVLDVDLTDDMQDNVFILSASFDDDLLNQWQHYAGRGGFAVGVNPLGQLAPRVIAGGVVVHSRTGGTPFPGWRRVVYSLAEQEDRAWQMLLFTVEATPGTVDTWQDHLDAWPYMVTSYRLPIQNLVCQIKDPAFEAEREVRFVAASRGHEPFEHFRVTGGGGLVPYVKLAVTDYMAPGGYSQSTVGGALPIEEIVCGPSSDSNVEASVRRLLRATGYDRVAVRSSRVPFR